MYLKRILTYSMLTLTALSGFFGVHITNNPQHTQVIPFQIAITSNTYAATPTTPAATATTPAKDTTSSTAVKKYNDMIDVLNIALGVISFMVSPIILFVGWLMSPDWTSGDLFGLRAPMYTLWITVSNIVYFIYAILLILIALGTMFSHATFSYKVMLPKLALGILMVPFTWWFVQWTISIASVVTASVMTIPMETMAAIEAKNKSPWFSKTESIPKSITIGSGATKASDCSKGECITPQKFLENSAGMYGPLVVYGYSVFKFQRIEQLESGVDIATAALKIVHSSIVTTIMFAVFGILIIALAAILIIRAVKLWMYAIFSPLFTFQFVAGSGIMGGNKDTFTLREFMGLAFVPAIVGLALSFGLIMIASVQGTNTTGTSGTKTETCDLTKGCNMTIMGSPNNSIFRKWEKEKEGYKTTTTFTWGEMKIHFLGKATNQADPNSSTQGTIDSAGGIFGTIIIDVIALVFIWLAFMAAKNVSKAVEAAISPFEAIGSKIGKLATSMPQYIPLPVPGGSMRGMNKSVDGIEGIMQHKSNVDFENSGMGQWIKQQSNGASADDIKKVKDAVDKGGIEGVKEMQKLSNDLRAIGKGEQLYGQAQRDNLNKYAEQVKSGKIKETELNEAYGNKIGSDLYNKLHKTGKIESEDEAKIVAAMLASRNGDDSITSVKMAEDRLRSGAVTPPSGTPSSTGNTTTVGERKNTAGDNYNISITNQPIDFKMDNSGKLSDISGLDRLKGKKAGMKEEDFIRSLQNEGKLTQEGAKTLAKEIKDKEKDFFDTP